jgi:hypothetical protein
VVELIEYVLIFGISAGVAAASVIVVEGAMPGLGSIATVSKADQIAGAARIAIEEGRNVTVLLPLQDVAISCAAGSLSVSSAGYAGSYELGYPCSFDLRSLSGDCDLTFSSPGGALLLEVSC